MQIILFLHRTQFSSQTPSERPGSPFRASPIHIHNYLLWGSPSCISYLSSNSLSRRTEHPSHASPICNHSPSGRLGGPPPFFVSPIWANTSSRRPLSCISHQSSHSLFQEDRKTFSCFFYLSSLSFQKARWPLLRFSHLYSHSPSRRLGDPSYTSPIWANTYLPAGPSHASPIWSHLQGSPSVFLPSKHTLAFQEARWPFRVSPYCACTRLQGGQGTPFVLSPTELTLDFQVARGHLSCISHLSSLTFREARICLSRVWKYCCCELT